MLWIRQRVSPELSIDTIPPPWNASRKTLLQNIGAIAGRNGLEEFNRWKASQAPLNLFVFSDGALIDGRAGSGYVIYRGLTHRVGQGTLPLGESAEVYDAEIAGATEGLDAALHNPMAQLATNITVCLDNQEAALRLLIDTPTQSSSSRIARFRHLATRWIERECSYYSKTR